MNANDSEFRETETIETPPLAPASPVFPARYVRFGAFQLDLQREDLFKNGERLRLQGKVFQTLLILLNRAGNVVTRDEVRRHLWPENLQVNFDANVNTTMNKLRQALGDSPENPVYIETIPRRGYCFLPEVEFSDVPLPIAEKSREALTRSAVRENPADADREPPIVLSTGWRIAILVLAGMVVGALLVLAWFALGRSHKQTVSVTRSEIAFLAGTRS